MMSLIHGPAMHFPTFTSCQSWPLSLCLDNGPIGVEASTVSVQPHLQASSQGRAGVVQSAGQAKGEDSRVPVIVETGPNAKWPLDFMRGQLAHGHWFRRLNAVGDVVWECFAKVANVLFRATCSSNMLDPLATVSFTRSDRPTSGVTCTRRLRL